MARPVSGWDEGPTPWLGTYPVGVPTSYRYPTVPAARLLDDAAQDFPDAIAVEYRRYRMTYRKLLDHVDRFATALSELGVTADDHVVIALPNCPQLIIALFATWRIGAAATLLPRTRMASALPDGVRVVVTLDRWYHTAGTTLRAVVPPRCHVVVTARGDYLPFPRNVVSMLRSRRLRSARSGGVQPDHVLQLADLVRRSVPAPQEPADTHQRAAVTATQGTVTQHRLVVNSFQLRLWLPDVVAGDERFLLAVPLVAAVGTLWMLTAVLSAATMILVDESRATQRQRSAVGARPTILPLDDDVTSDLLRTSWRRGQLHSVRIALSVGTLDEHVRARLERLTDMGRVRRAWGIFGLLTHADPIYGRVEVDSVGLPLPDTEAVVVPAGSAAPVVGMRGRLWVRGPQLARSQWVDTGLEATLAASGHLTVHCERPDAQR
ncbi:hypothetical protein BH23ACT10_BH23ACT10_04940 [soil metagenome]